MEYLFVFKSVSVCSDTQVKVWMNKYGWTENEDGQIFIFSQEESVKPKNIVEKIDFESQCLIETHLMYFQLWWKHHRLFPLRRCVQHHGYISVMKLTEDLHLTPTHSKSDRGMNFHIQNFLNKTYLTCTSFMRLPFLFLFLILDAATGFGRFKFLPVGFLQLPRNKLPDVL